MPDFLSYTRRNLDFVLPMIEQAIYTRLGTLTINAWRTPEPVPFDQRETGEHLDLNIGDSWGNLFDCAWFHFTGQVPTDAAGQTVVLILDVNGEMLIFDAAGVPLRGLTNGSSVFDYSLGKPGKRILPLFSPAVGGETIDLWADAGSNDLFGHPQENSTIKEAFIAVCDEAVRGLYYDYEVLLDFLAVLPENTPRSQQILKALNTAAWSLAQGITPATVQAARSALQPQLAKRGGDPSLNISAEGHAHIDLAWLWPLRESRRKGGRTFATALANMKRYPNYIFGASQPQLFQWVKEDYPQLYNQVKEQVKAGRFEPQGAMWVEADTNVTGGESLVRQILYGKRFFQQEFGVEPDFLWLPDVFGYSGALPQILKKAGIRYFMTQKLSWNQVNTFPHHSFHWQGIDGSSVLAHMLPEETYNSPAMPRSVTKIESNYHDKGVSEHALMLFGIGDGGGGPGEEHLERLERIRNLAGLSPVTQQPAAQFFQSWVKDSAQFPTWVGELYLERHSGTLTTQARNKWYNRRIEQALRQLEWVAVMAGDGDAYPRAQLDAIWREVLLYQFHDILPGSSIKRVYDESVTRYQIMLESIQALISHLTERLTQAVDSSEYQKPVIVLNSLSWPREAWTLANGRWVYAHVPSLGYQVIETAGSPDAPSPTADSTYLENDLLRVTFTDEGSIESIFDKAARREVLPPGQMANRLVVYHDPGDAWDFPLDYANQTPRPLPLVSAVSRVDGPCAIRVQTYRLGESELTQEIRLTTGSRRLDFCTQTIWREREIMLRTSFPIAVHTAEAACEIQYGHIYRPTHSNTTWDLAKDEVAAHKWVDLSQRDYGVALLNDSKYGHRIKNGVIDLNLLRSVPYPGYNPAINQSVEPGQPHPGYTDQAEHLFNYALYPHPGDLVAGKVIQAAYEFNTPLQIKALEAHPGQRPQSGSLLTIDADNIVVEAVKLAEDNEEIIIRLYESTQANTLAHLQFGLPINAIVETDLLERPIRELDWDGQTLNLAFTPFEIKTIKLTRLPDNPPSASRA